MPDIPPQTPAPATEPPALERWLFVGAAGAALLCAVALALFPSFSDDLFIHLAVGRRFFAYGFFPETDPFLYSIPGYRRDWLDVWGSHAGAYGLYLLGGFAALELTKTALVALAALAPLWLAVRLGRRSWIAPAVLLVALWAGCARFVERASLVTDVAGAWVLALCCAERLRPSRWRWVIPAVFLVWTQLHAGVLLGLFYVGASAVTQPRAWRRWLPLVGACVVASCVHPRGPAILWWALQGMLGSGFDEYRKHYAEFQPTFSHFIAATRDGVLFCVLLAATAPIAVREWRRGASPRRRSRASDCGTSRYFTASGQVSSPWFGLLCLGALGYLGLSAVRFLTAASLGVAVLAVALAADAGPEPGASNRRDRARRLRVAALAATAIAGLVLSLKVFGWGYTTYWSSSPRRTGIGLDARLVAFAVPADFLAGLPLVGRIWNEHQLGAYLAWRWDGKPQLFYHGYVLDQDFYRNEYLAAYRSPEEFDRIVRSYDIDAFIFLTQPPPATSGTVFNQVLLRRPEWRLVYWDSRVEIFLRDRPEYREVIERYELRYCDPFRPERVVSGAREAPDRLYQEAVRVLLLDPEQPYVRRLISTVFHREPDEILKQARRPAPAPLAPAR